MSVRSRVTSPGEHHSFAVHRKARADLSARWRFLRSAGPRQGWSTTRRKAAITIREACHLSSQVAGENTKRFEPPLVPPVQHT
ncbi:unnamed protein product [Calypogeia fissa]